jgi:DNA-binding transcriptional ArsR family regulator
MGWWQVDADTLAGGRFVLSALAETTAALLTLHRDSAAHPGEHEWLRAHRAGYRERLAADPLTGLLVDSALRPRWIADLVTPPPADVERPFEEELCTVQATPPERARADLAVALGGRLPAALDRDDLGPRLAELLRWVWRYTVEPGWPRRRRVLEADVIARTRQLSLGGWATALGDLRGGMRWLGQGRFQINAYDYPPRDISGAQLLFVPVTTSRGWVAWHEARYAVIYRASGVLADADRAEPATGALEPLLGRVRARVLLLLDAPKSTTQICALTGQALGSIGRHLKVLLDAGLVLRRRAGRNVLYSRTAAGDTLVRAAQAGRP